jgi:hypothetical protein
VEAIKRLKVEAAEAREWADAALDTAREECSRDVNELLAALVEHEVLDAAREAATTEATSRLPGNEDDELRGTNYRIKVDTGKRARVKAEYRDLIVDLGVLVR